MEVLQRPYWDRWVLEHLLKFYSISRRGQWWGDSPPAPHVAQQDESDITCRMRNSVRSDSISSTQKTTSTSLSTPIFDFIAAYHDTKSHN